MLWMIVKYLVLLYAALGLVYVSVMAVSEERRDNGGSVLWAIWKVYGVGSWRMATEFSDSLIVAIVIGVPVTIVAFVLMHLVLWPFSFQSRHTSPQRSVP